MKWLMAEGSRLKGEKMAVGFRQKAEGRGNGEQVVLQPFALRLQPFK